jgi:hypothetical protein
MVPIHWQLRQEKAVAVMVVVAHPNSAMCKVSIHMDLEVQIARQLVHIKIHVVEVQILEPGLSICHE